MTDMEWTPPLGERMTRLETLFEANLSGQIRRDEIAIEERRELAACVQSLVARLDKFEPVILGDKALGQKSLGERLETVERAILAAKVGWRTATFIGTAFFGLLSAVAYVLHWAPTFSWPGSSSNH